MALSKTELLKKSSHSEKIAAPEEELLCQSSYSEEVSRSGFYKSKALLKKLLNIREGKSPFENKKSQINLVITFN